MSNATKASTVVRKSEAKTARVAARGADGPAYQSGFGNHFSTEAIAGALPVGRNSPQRPPHGLYTELISGTSFTTARADNRRTWTYRIQPSVVHRPYARLDDGLIRSAPFNDVDATPTQLRWSRPTGSPASSRSAATATLRRRSAWRCTSTPPIAR